MKEILYFWLDFLDYVILGLLLVHLFKGLVPERFSGAFLSKSQALFCMQFAGVRMFISHSAWMRQLIYGKEMYLAHSRQSIIPVAISMAITLLSGYVLYRGGRMRLLTLVTAYYAFWELIRFVFYPLAVGSVSFAAEYVNHLFWEAEAISGAQYQQIMAGIEFVWNILISLLVFLSLLFCIVRYKRYLTLEKNGHFLARDDFFRHKEAALTFVPGLLGLVFVGMLRTILFYYNKKVYSLIEDYPELNVLIPFLSLLCIASILISAKMLGEIKAEHEKRRQAELYQSRAEELEAHVRDMEDVQIQIRGMKHDMKNYIADINALLAQMASGDKKAEEEIRRYVSSMQTSIENLDVERQTGNPVTDVILGRYARIARQKRISFSGNFIYPKHLGIDVFDMSVILNNGLENAFEACEKESGESCVSLSVSQKGHMFLISIENSFSGTLKWEGELPVSEKSGDSHGLGLKNIKNCAEKYFGKADIKVKDGRFCLTVMLQGTWN